jgi:hypothetical protein
VEFWADVVPRWDQYHEGANEWKLEGRSFNGNERHCAFRNKGDGTFEDVAYVYGIDGIEDGRGAITADLDGDGAPELIVNNHRVPARIWRARPDERRWCTVELDYGRRMNPHAVGATVVCRVAKDRVQALPVSAGTAFLSQAPQAISFGMGKAAEVQIEVRWPDGRRSMHRALGQGHWVVKPDGSAAKRR